MGEKTELVQHYVGKTRTDAPHKVVKESLGLASSTKKIFTNKLHQLERSKTKEIESLQQEIQQMGKNRDLLMSSEEMLKRALQEMEEKIKTINKQNEENIVQLNQKHFEKLSNIETIIMSKNDLICKNERQIKEVREAGKATEEEVLKLRQEVKDRDDILTVIKKKEKAVLKDIKRQLLNEK